MSMTKHSPEYIFMYETDCDDCHRVNIDCTCGEDEPEPVNVIPVPNYAGWSNVTIGDGYENLQRR